ncbi:MAG TPA: acetate kinase [Acidobacteriota bacterium]|nr:acetate kinase [Acidobacteriota bacterium]
MIVLVVNCGSSSLRFQLIEAEGRQRLARGHVERIGAVSSIATLAQGAGDPQRHGLKADDHGQALNFVLDYLTSDDFKVLDGIEEIQAVGHRVVHGGEHFSDSMLIDAEVIEAIREAFDLAPLHNPANLKGIQAAQSLLPEVPQVAVFDTAFHQTLPREAYLYAIPHRLYRRYKIRRYGFHGTSHYYVSRRLYKIGGLEKSHSKLITCHLGNGASVAAVENGRSVDTSMGLTPLAGLVMGTRSGDIDPSVIFYLNEKEEMTLNEIHSLLNRYSGLLGLSGYAGDMRALMKEAEEGDVRCQQAINVFCYRVKSCIGQYMAVMNGCDALVFTAGIGENSHQVRARICRGLDNLGIELDEVANREVRGEGRISKKDSKASVWVIPTDEEMVIAIDAMKIAQAAHYTPWA